LRGAAAEMMMRRGEGGRGNHGSCGTSFPRTLIHSPWIWLTTSHDDDDDDDNDWGLIGDLRPSSIENSPYYRSTAEFQIAQKGEHLGGREMEKE